MLLILQINNKLNSLLFGLVLILINYAIFKSSGNTILIGLIPILFTILYNYRDISKIEKLVDEKIQSDFDIEDVELFMDDKEFLPTNMLLIEYVSGITFEHLCKKNSVENRNLILSQIIEFSFTFYIL